MVAHADVKPPQNLNQLLDKLSEASANGGAEVSLADVVEAIGRRSFGPLLLVVGLLATSPITSIPGMPTTFGVLVALIAVQLLLRRDRFWLPRWIASRRMKREKL